MDKQKGMRLDATAIGLATVRGFFHSMNTGGSQETPAFLMHYKGDFRRGDAALDVQLRFYEFNDGSLGWTDKAGNELTPLSIHRARPVFPAEVPDADVRKEEYVGRMLSDIANTMLPSTHFELPQEMVRKNAGLAGKILVGMAKLEKRYGGELQKPY